MLLDAAIPGGDAFELVTKITKTLPATKCELLTARDYMARAHATGAANCLLKSVTRKELVTAIENAAAGKPASGSAPFARIAAAVEPRDAPTTTRDSPLTPRENQVLSHVALGLFNDEIARSLKISTETVKEHVQNLLRKLSARDRTQAAVWAVQSGVV